MSAPADFDAVVNCVKGELAKNRPPLNIHKVLVKFIIKKIKGERIC